MHRLKNLGVALGSFAATEAPHRWGKITRTLADWWWTRIGVENPNRQGDTDD